MQTATAPPPSCLSHKPHSDCPAAGTWPTSIDGVCPAGFDWSPIGVCFRGSEWRCPAGSQTLIRIPFCAAAGDTTVAALYPELRCYAWRYPDLQQYFCNNDISNDGNKCEWRQLLRHYRVSGKKEARVLDCPPEGLSSQARAICLIHVSSCISFPQAAGWGWFDDAVKGGPPHPSLQDCIARARSWMRDCGGRGATVTYWHRATGAPSAFSFVGDMRKAKAPPPSCLSHEPHSDCPAAGTWPTSIDGVCPAGFDWSPIGVCFRGSEWRCPAGSQTLIRIPFCAAAGDTTVVALYPELRCYAWRYPELQQRFCTSNRGQRCSTKRMLQYYREQGKKTGQLLECLGGTSQNSVRRYPNVLVSDATAKVLHDTDVTFHATLLTQHTARSSKPALDRPPPTGSRARISFEVCGGLINQRLAIIDALMIGHLLDATVLLPSLNLNGRQVGTGYAEPEKRLTSSTAFFDFQRTQAALSPLVHIALEENESPFDEAVTKVREHAHGKNWYEDLLSVLEAERTNGSTPLHRQPSLHIRFDCTLFSLNKQDDAMQKLFWEIDAALVPSTEIQRIADVTVSRLRARSEALGSGGRFTALHLRVEDDWIEHCARWESNTSVPPRDNCMTNTDNLHRVFAIEGVDNRHPLYVATEDEATPLRANRGLRSLDDFELSSKLTLWPAGTCEQARACRLKKHRELGAMHDYLVLEASDRFIGNSISSFSAFLELKRERSRAGAADDFHYNGGDNPLQKVLFGDVGNGVWPDEAKGRRRLKWFFTINGNLSHSFFEMTKVAVASAIKNTDLTPVCVHVDPLADHVSLFFKLAGVRVLQHEPKWRPRIFEALLNARHQLDTSTNYQEPHKMLSTFARLDIPTLGIIDPYVLYADVDMMFVGAVTLRDFAPPPAFYAVGTEAVDEMYPEGVAYGNAGVMLMNVEAMRRTHGAFIEWVFSKTNLKNALHFAQYGPLDQGAYNAYYQDNFDVHRSPAFNWKPYWGYSPRATMVHFHGPKPHEYLLYHHGGAKGINPNLVGILQQCDKAPGCLSYAQTWLRWKHSITSGNGAGFRHVHS